MQRHLTQRETTPLRRFLTMRHFEVLEGVHDAVFIDGGGDVVGVLREFRGGVAHGYAYSCLKNH